jgi:hypothetical protein
MSREEKTTKMLAMVDQFRASGMTQEQFVNDHGIAISVLRYWLAKSRQESNGPGFIQLDATFNRNFGLCIPTELNFMFRHRHRWQCFSS